MKGLLLKELYMVNKYCRSYFLIAIIFAAASAVTDSTFMMFYPLLLTGMIPVSLISYDERSRWDVYANVFPYTRKQMVTAKYLITFFYVTATVILLAVAGLVRNTFFLSKGASTLAYLTMVSLMPLLGLLVPSIMLPPVFKLGAEKGRMLYYVEIVLVCVLIGVLGTFTQNGSFLRASVSGWVAIPLSIVLAFAIFAASWALSVKFYEKREV